MTVQIIFVLCLLWAERVVGQHACDSPIYCHGSILEQVQTRRLYPDSKTFVDMKMKFEPAVILERFELLQAQHGSELSDTHVREFVEDHFSGPGQELESWVPDDWVQTPSIIQRIHDPNLRQWAFDINELWKILGRKMSDEVRQMPERHSLLYVPKPFVIPGDRFREFYYWDTYWVIGGLLQSDMASTARGMLENLLHMVKEHGHVPNGGRVYYIRRAQPPLLSSMVDLYVSSTGDRQFAIDNLPLLIREYEFWLKNRTIEVTSPSGKIHRLAHYAPDLGSPRPEGYMEDVHLSHARGAEESKQLFSDLAGACESGWDFSSRWMKLEQNTLHSDLSMVQTSKIIPVDLNSFLYQTEKLLAKFHTLAGDQDTANLYHEAAEERRGAIQDLLWNEEDGIWYDYDLHTNSHRMLFYPSNIMPLYAGCAGQGNDLLKVTDRVLNYLARHQLWQYPGGVPTSQLTTGQQWDFPNTWPPLVHLMVEGLDKTGHPEAQRLALNLTQTWLQSTWKTFNTYGHMFEKYDSRFEGIAGHGGEYSVQLGFGWSNGAALMLLDKYASQLSVNAPEAPVSSAVSPIVRMVAGSVFLLITILTTMYLLMRCYPNISNTILKGARSVMTDLLASQAQSNKPYRRSEEWFYRVRYTRANAQVRRRAGSIS